MIVQLRSPGFQAEIDLEEVNRAYGSKIKFFDGGDTQKWVVRRELSKVKVKKILKLIAERTEYSEHQEIGESISELYPKLYPIWKEVVKDV